jgi:hypothetical protein
MSGESVRDSFGRLVRVEGASPPYNDPAGDNCLKGIRCPNCKAVREFTVNGHVWEDDGCFTSNEHPTDDPGSPCECGDCGHRGRVRDFLSGE